MLLLAEVAVDLDLDLVRASSVLGTEAASYGDNPLRRLLSAATAEPAHAS